MVDTAAARDQTRGIVIHQLIQAAAAPGRNPKAWKRTTPPGQRPVPAPNLIGRVFGPAHPPLTSGSAEVRIRPDLPMSGYCSFALVTWRGDEIGRS